MNKLSIIAVLGCVVAYAVQHTTLPNMSFDMPVGGLPFSGWLFFGGVIAVLVVLLLALDYLSKLSNAVWRRAVSSLGPVALVILVIAGLALTVVR